MQKTISIEGGEQLKLSANAATPFRFKQVFNTDLLRVFQQSTQSEEDGMILGNLAAQMAFIMNKQAEGADMNSLSMDDFYAWLERFEAMDFVNAGEEIVRTYLGSTQTSVEAKKK